MASVLAVVCPIGVQSPNMQFSVERQAQNDVSPYNDSRLIGAAVTEAIDKAWRAGFSPLRNSPFVVLVSFK